MSDDIPTEWTGRDQREAERIEASTFVYMEHLHHNPPPYPVSQWRILSGMWGKIGEAAWALRSRRINRAEQEKSRETKEQFRERTRRK